jgi:putative N6-adenine-specific DNA methylase
MSFFTTQAPIIVTCNRRLSPYVAKEIEALGFLPEEVFATGIRLNGTLNDCIRLNLSLRCASQVLYRLDAFNAINAEELYKVLHDYPWEKLLADDGYFSVTSNVFNDTINNNLFANLRVKDAIVDRLRAIRGIRPSTGAELSGAVIHLHWKGDEAQIFIDSSGNSLGRHGYRKLPGRAPMLEALAAATIMATRWDGSSPFINPMCGSGTLAIEAALIATNTVPGVFRTDYSFMHIKGYDEEVYLQEQGRIEQAIKEGIQGLRIIATDYSAIAVENARKNARAAGVDDLIEFSVCDFRETEVPVGGRGVMMINPEYGERLGDVSELEDTYKGIGDFMKSRCGGYWGYVFTGNMELAKHIGLKAKRRVEFYTSKIDARLFEYELYEGSRREPRAVVGSPGE